MNLHENNLTLNELVCLSKLYSSKYKKRIFNQKIGSYKNLIEELRSWQYSEVFIYRFLIKCHREGILTFKEFKNNEYHFIVNTPKVLEILQKQVLYNEIKNIVEEESTLHIE